MTATKIQPGDDLHLTLLMAPHSLNFVTGPDRAALLAFGRDVFAAARDSKCLAQIEEPAQPVAEICSASHDDAEFGERAIKPLCDISGFEYGTPLYAGAAPAAAAPRGEYPHEQMDAMALDRYKVVPSNASMLWSHAVVAGDGTQQLYVGREVECQNMARKFAGAFLDGAFAFHSTAAAPTAPAAPALEAPAAPARLDGWKLVPEVATREMCAAMLSFLKDGFSLTENGSRPMSALYADLLAAAPQAPAAPILSAEPLPVMPRAITSGLGLDDSGEEPAYCVMAAFRSEDDARYALSILSAGLGATAAPAAPAVDAQAHAETLKKAARYDFLRGSNVANGTVLAEHFGGSRMQDFDAVIDAKIAARAAQAKEGGAPVADAAPLDVCTDPYNCARCKTHPAHRGDMHHAGISRIGGSA
ncbi:hypothetical protein [Polaromonas sp.]|uniref:hypothetical protein n=1 Tax=Polaromonas sp. TaxID=1869339 RepID=UPI00352BB991